MEVCLVVYNRFDASSLFHMKKKDVGREKKKKKKIR
jgi:hypothetical protein